jgi:hypothetical protein
MQEAIIGTVFSQLLSIIVLPLIKRCFTLSKDGKNEAHGLVERIPKTEKKANLLKSRDAKSRV